MDYEEYNSKTKQITGVATRVVGGRIAFIPGIVLAIIAVLLLISGIATMATSHYIWGTVLLLLSYVLFRSSKRLLIG
jgi:UPF0716 family protein affecting phage T7 exclusion